MSEAPSFNSRDRKVVVKGLEIIEEVRRTGMNVMHVGPSGLVGVAADRHPDLTVELFHNGASRLV